MKKIITALVIVGLMSMSLTALAYDGSYPECLGSPIEYTGDTPQLTDTSEHRDDGAIRFGTTGTFLIVSYNNTGERGMILGDVLSIEVPLDAVAVEVCMDGTVTFTLSETTVHGIHTHEESVDLIGFWLEWGYEMGLIF